MSPRGRGRFDPVLCNLGCTPLVLYILQAYGKCLYSGKPLHWVEGCDPSQEFWPAIGSTLLVGNDRGHSQPLGPITPGSEQVNCFKSGIDRGGQDRNGPSRTLSKHADAISIQVTAHC